MIAVKEDTTNSGRYHASGRREAKAYWENRDWRRAFNHSIQ